MAQFGRPERPTGPPRPPTRAVLVAPVGYRQRIAQTPSPVDFGDALKVELWGGRRSQLWVDRVEKDLS
jgi:hypothetical protein